MSNMPDFKTGFSSAAFDFKRALWLVMKYGISAACLFYAFRGVPLSDLSAALGRYPIPPALAAAAVAFAAYALMGIRLSRMADPPLAFRSTFRAALVGLAVNNVLPAKAGEIVKAVWIGRENGVPSQKIIGIVFMERFFDVNVLALMSLWLLWVMGSRAVFAAFLLCLLIGWCVLTVFSKNKKLAERFAALFGKGRLGTFVSQALSGVLDNMSAGRLLWLSVTSLAIWSIYTLQMYLCLNVVAGLRLDWSGVFSIFAVSGLSMLLPSSPGAIGVYEAFTVTLLERYGIERDAALAVALLSHMIQFIPVTLIGGLIFMAFPAKRALEK